MRFPVIVQRVAQTIRIPALAGVLTLAALAFSTAPAHAACTVGGGAAIDGFAVGASVNCPTGTVLAGTVPPDGATITNKNFAGGSTTFTYTTPAVGTVQLAGNVSLTAATGAPTSDAVAAAVANNNAQVQALFGGGIGGPTSTEISLDAGTTFGPAAPNPQTVVDLGRAQTLLTNLESRQEALKAEIQVSRAAIPSIQNERRDTMAALNAELEALENAPPPDPFLSEEQRNAEFIEQQNAIAAKEKEIEDRNREFDEGAAGRLATLTEFESILREKEAELERIELSLIHI